MTGCLLWAVVVSVQIQCPTEVPLGKAFELTVVRTWSAELRPDPWDPAVLQPLEVKSLGVVRSTADGVTREELRFHAYAFARDALVVTSFPFKARGPDGAVHEAASPQLNLIVESALDAAEPGPVELPGAPMAEPFHSGPLLRWLALALATAGGGLLLFRSLRRRGGAGSRLSAAAEAEGRLRSAQALPQGSAQEVQAYYLALTDLVRDYVERAYGVHVPGMTTEQFLGSPQVRGALGGETQELLGRFLGECDRVKFGRLPTTVDDRAAAWRAAEGFVLSPSSVQSEASS